MPTSPGTLSKRRQRWLGRHRSAVEELERAIVGMDFDAFSAHRRAELREEREQVLRQQPERYAVGQ